MGAWGGLKSGMINLVYAGTTANSFSTYQECYMKRLSKYDTNA